MVGPTPQAYIFTLLELHARRREAPTSSATMIETLGRLGVSEQVTRLTLARMGGRGYLERHRLGRRTCFSGTDRGARGPDPNEARGRGAGLGRRGPAGRERR